MIVKTSSCFWDDLSKIKHADILDETEIAFEFAAKCKTPDEIPGFKYLERHPGYGRIKAGNYRIGVKYSPKTIIFYRILHRSIVYKSFPK